MQEQGFTVSLPGLPYSRISCDQGIEMTKNRSSKNTGDLSGKTEILVRVKDGCVSITLWLHLENTLTH